MQIIKAEKFSSNIVVCVIDTANRITDNWAKEVAYNLTDEYIDRFLKFSFDVVIDKDEDDLLTYVSNCSLYRYAVVMSLGVSANLSNDFYKIIKEYCTVNNFSLSGHILDRKDYYYELHQQFYILNLNHFKELGQPRLGQEENDILEAIVPERSIENVHDDYTPLWIKQGNNKKIYKGKLHGWNLIKVFLDNNKEIINLPNNLRNTKKYFYYEYSHVFRRDVEHFFYESFLGKNFVVPYSTDVILPEVAQCVKNFPVEQFITVASGIQWIKYLNIMQYSNNTTIKFCDCNYNSLLYIKKLVETWNGRDYFTFYKENAFAAQFDNEITANRYKDEIYKEFELFKEDYKDFEIIWNNIKTLKFEYILLDLLGSVKLNWIEPNKKTFVNISDVFIHRPAVVFAPLLHRIRQESLFIKKLQDIDPEIYLNFSDRAVTRFIMKDVKHFGKVKDFELIKMQDLNLPYWTNNDERILLY